MSNNASTMGPKHQISGPLGRNASDVSVTRGPKENCFFYPSSFTLRIWLAAGARAVDESKRLKRILFPVAAVVLSTAAAFMVMELLLWT